MQFNWDLVVNSFPLLLVGAGVTIKITAMSVALGVIIGLFVGIARICHFKPLRFVAAVYVDFFRGTPLFKAPDPYTGALIGPESSEFTSKKNLFAYQAKTIRELAEKEPCVIVGKAAGFVLKNEPNLVRVFVHAPYWFLRQEAARRNSLTEKELDKYIEKENKRRADYNYYYTGEKWNDAHNYDLCVDASKLGFEKCVKIIEGYMKVRFDGLQF